MHFHYVIMLLVAVGCLPVGAADGIYERPTLSAVPSRFEGAELRVNVPLTPATLPEASAVFLYDADEGANEPFRIHVAFRMPLGKRMRVNWKPVIVLGDTTVLEVEPGHLTGGYPPYLSFGVKDGEQAVELMNRLAAVLKLPSDRVKDMRLADHERNTEVNIIGNFPDQEVEGVRAAAYEYGRQQAIWMFTYLLDKKEGEAALEKWPGRHPLRIGATRYPTGGAIAAWYAPNGGCQLEKHEGKWVVVGG